VGGQGGDWGNYRLKTKVKGQQQLKRFDCAPMLVKAV